MSTTPTIPEMHSYEEIAEFWDTHSNSRFWDQTERAEFELSPYARRRYFVAVDRDLLKRVHSLARQRGIATESLVNLLIEQRLHELEMQPG